MNSIVLAFGIFWLCGWTVPTESSQPPGASLTLDAVSKPKKEDTETDLDKERRNKLRAEVSRVIAIEKKLQQDEVIEQQRQREERWKTFAGLFAPAVPANNSNTGSQQHAGILTIKPGDQGHQTAYAQPECLLPNSLHLSYPPASSVHTAATSIASP